MRRFATAAFAFAAGIFLAQYLLPGELLLPAAGAAGAAFGLCLLLQGDRRVRALLIAGGLCAALVYDCGYVALVQTPAEVLAESYLPDAVLEVCGWPQATDTGAKVPCRLRREGTRLVKVVYYAGEELLALRPGDVLAGGVYVVSAARVNDSDITSFTSKGVFLLAYQREDLAVTPGGDPPEYLPQRVGRAVQDKLAELFDGDVLALLRAILTGDKSGFSQGVRNDLSETGLLHITAVSGMHCAFLLALLRLLVGKHRQRLLAAVAIPVLAFYALLVGATPSVVRACVMLIFLLLAPLLGRESDGPTAVSAALALILLQNPFAAASVSLQLSFAAVAGLLCLTPRVYRGLLGGKKKKGKRGRRRLGKFVASSLAATAGALVFTVPLTAVYFDILVLVSPLSNLLCLWAASLVFATGLAAVLLGFLSLPLGLAAAWAPRLLTGYFLGTAHELARAPYHAVYFTNDYLKYWLAYAYALFGCCLAARGETRRRYVSAGALAALGLALAVRLGAIEYRYGALDIVAVDVGQGECVLLHSGGSTAMMDCGSSNRWISAGDQAADTLATMGVGKLDYLALSHYHADHANGIEALLARVEVGTMLLPDIGDEYGLKDRLLALAKTHGVEVAYIRETASYPLGEATLTLYPPLGSGSTNEEGVTGLCSAGDFDFLITGDMDETTEKKLLAAYPLPDLEGMMVGHHGSRYSTSEELLEWTRPEVAVVSVGDNSYGHPTDEALHRLTRAGAAVYRTDLQGNIHIRVEPDEKE